MMRRNPIDRRKPLGFFVLVALTGIAMMVSSAGSAAAQTAAPTVDGCSVFPADSIWNAPVDHLPVDRNSSAYIANIGAVTTVHPDFGSGEWAGGPIGIPYNIVSGLQPRVPITFDYSDESDAGPYPIPPNAQIEGGSGSSGDRHVLVIDRDNCVLYETWSTYPLADGSWQAGSGAIFNLRSNALRPDGWTSADAAGLPVFAGLVRYEEVASGEIRHALRFTAPRTQRAYVWPARHYASSITDIRYPPMGQHFRLKAGFDVSGFSPQVQVILQALKKYGMILADNGSPWYLSGAPDPRWNNDVLVSELRRVKGSDFEAVDVSSLMADPDSGRVASGDPDPQAPVISIAPESHGYEDVPVGGGSSTAIFTVFNTGGAELLIGAIGVAGTNAGDFEVLADGCSNQAIAPSGDCTFGARFAPKSAGSKTGSVVIPSNDPQRPELAANVGGKAILQNALSITSPNGGEDWKVRTTHLISWSYTGALRSPAKIELFKEGVLKRRISSRAPLGSNGAGSYRWIVPATLTPGGGYRVKVTVSVNGTMLTDASDGTNTISK